MTNLEDKNFSDNLLSKIKEEKINPKPKWQFSLKNSLIWVLGFISLVLGAIATSLIFYMLLGEEPGFVPGHPRTLEALLVLVPFFWITCLLFFAVSVFYYIKHTKKGYKYSPKIIILGIVGVSLVFGGTLSAFGVDRVIDDVLGEKAPMYDRVINPRLDYWSNPEEGRLTGMIVSQEAKQIYNLVDREGKTWIIKTSDEADSKKIKVNHPVRLMGEKTADYNFSVTEVMSVGPGRGFFKRPLPPKMLPGEYPLEKCNNGQVCKEWKDNFFKEKNKPNPENKFNR